MSLIIKGMKLPKTGRVDISIDAKGKIYSKTPGLAFWKYAAVEIPTPHGRLIDANKLEAMMYHEAFEIDSDMQKWDSGCWIRYKVFENCMNRLLPDTIIEAEEQDDQA